MDSDRPPCQCPRGWPVHHDGQLYPYGRPVSVSCIIALTDACALILPVSAVAAVAAARVKAGSAAMKTKPSPPRTSDLEDESADEVSKEEDSGSSTSSKFAKKKCHSRQNKRRLKAACRAVKVAN